MLTLQSNRNSVRDGLSALLVIYWLVFVGAGVSPWLASTGRLPADGLMSAIHWGLLLCLIMMGVVANWAAVQRGWKPSLWQIGLGMLLFLAICDGVLRSGLLNMAVLSSAMACLLILAFDAAFRDEFQVRIVAFATIAVVILHVAYLTFELFHDRFLSQEYGRAAGLLLNPNVAGSAIVILGMSAVNWVPGRWKLGYLCLIGFGVLLTLSRSSIIAYSAGVAWLVGWQLLRGGKSVLFAGWPMALAVCVGGLLLISVSFVGENRYKYALLDSVSELAEVISGEDLRLAQKLAEHQLANTIAEASDGGGVAGAWSHDDGQRSLHSVDSSAIDELTLISAGELNSALSRALLFRRSLESFLDHMWFGIGVANSFQMRAHNTALHLGNSYGVLGVLALVIFLLGYLLPEDPDGGRRAVGIALVVVTTFSHGVFANNPLVLAVAVSTVLLRPVR